MSIYLSVNLSIYIFPSIYNRTSLAWPHRRVPPAVKSQALCWPMADPPLPTPPG